MYASMTANTLFTGSQTGIYVTSIHHISKNVDHLIISHLPTGQILFSVLCIVFAHFLRTSTNNRPYDHEKHLCFSILYRFGSKFGSFHGTREFAVGQT